MSKSIQEQWMREDQRLYSIAIYAFNRELMEVVEYLLSGEDGGASPPVAIPSLFSSHTRTFHWLAVKNWRPNVAELLTEMVKEENTNDLKGFFNNLKASRLTSDLKEALENVYSYINHPITTNIQVPSDRHLLTLYQGFHNAPYHYIDGIIYRNLHELHNNDDGDQSKKIDYLKGRIHEDSHKPSEDVYGWVIETEFNDNDKKLDLPSCQRQDFYESSDSVMNIPSLTNEEKEELKARPGRKIVTFLNKKFIVNSVEKHTGNIISPYFFIVTPIYDIWIGKEAWGSLCGNVTLLFIGEDSLDAFITGDKLKEFRNECRQISQKLIESKRLMIANEPIEPPYSLVDHFVRNLNLLQDWECIIVYRGEEPQYCYHWHNEGSKNDDLDWTKNKWIRCDPEKKGSSQSPHDFCLAWEETDNAKFLRWEQDLNFWDSAFLTNIGNEEIEAFHDIRLAFEYPLSACIPGDENRRKALGEEYIRQQLEILRGLIPKVRARRAALRNAVVSIMSRNLSHNIGSHVLSALQNGTLEDHFLRSTDDQDKKEEKYKLDFNSAYQSLFSHLQARMDFIAEISTTRTTLHFSASLKEDIVGTDKKSPGSRAGMGFMGLELLRKYISARRENGSPVEGVIEFEGDAIAVDIVGGTLGHQALFTIFENVIRNVAKHTRDLELAGTGSDIVLKLRCDLEHEHPGYVKLTLWDMQHTATSMVNNEEKGENSQPTRKKLWEYLNARFEKVSFLKESGEPEELHWGLKEVYICATYLRGIALEDLENRMPAGEPAIMRVCPVDATGKEFDGNAKDGNIAHQFYLPVAQELAVVFDEVPTGIEESEALRCGIGFFSASEPLKSLPHRFVAWLCSSGPDAKTLGKLSPRWVNWPQGRKKEKLLCQIKKQKYNEAVALVRNACLDKELHNSSDAMNGQAAVYELNFDELNDLKGVFPSCPDSLSNELSKKNNEGFCEKIFRDAVILDYHFSIKNKRNLFPTSIKGVQYKFKGKFMDFLCVGGGYEFFPSVSKQNSLLSTWARTLDENTIQRMALRDLLADVLILDERVQESVHKNDAEHPFLAGNDLGKFHDDFPQYARHLGFASLLAASNVWIPAPADIDLYNPGKDLKGFLECLDNGGLTAPSGRKLDLKRIRYVVIHQGVIDRILRDNHKNSLEAFLEIIKDKILVVCSGRGRPPELRWVHKRRPDVRFIAVSAILEYVVNHPSKMHLVMSLNASRCPL